MSVERVRSVAKRGSVFGPPALGPVPEKALAAERLDADDRADLIAVDIEIADAGMLCDVVGDGLEAAVEAERQAIAAVVDGGDDLVEVALLEADDVQDRAEDFALQQ